MYLGFSAFFSEDTCALMEPIASNDSPAKPSLERNGAEVTASDHERDPRHQLQFFLQQLVLGMVPISWENLGQMYIWQRIPSLFKKPGP